MPLKFVLLFGLLCGSSSGFAQLPDPGNTFGNAYVPSAQFPVTGRSHGRARSVETEIVAEGNPVFFSYIGSEVPYETAMLEALEQCRRHHAVCRIASVDQYSKTRYQHQTLRSSMFGQPFDVQVNGSQTRTQARAVVLGFDRAYWDSEYVHCHDVIRVRFKANLGLAAVRQVPLGSLMDNGMNYGPPVAQPNANERIHIRQAYRNGRDACTLHVRKDLLPGDAGPDVDWTLHFH